MIKKNLFKSFLKLPPNIEPFESHIAHESEISEISALKLPLITITLRLNLSVKTYWDKEFFLFKKSFILV